MITADTFGVERTVKAPAGLAHAELNDGKIRSALRHERMTAPEDRLACRKRLLGSRAGRYEISR
jgi:hypothetical protein